MIVSSILADKLSDQPEFAAKAAELAKEATALVHWLQDEPEGPAKEAMRTAFTDSLRVVYIAMAAISLLATVASFWTRHYDIDQALKTDQGLSGAGEVE